MSFTVIVILAIAGLIILKKMKQSPAPNAVPAGLFAPSPPPAAPPRMKLLDLQEEFIDDIEREVKREGIKRRLQQASMDRWALERIAETYAPPKPPPADPKP